jgi:DNA-binding MarR family transcriptional regulator
MINLTAAGLTPTEAKCYTALLEKADWKPADLAKNVDETRTNCYKILDNLVALGLAERFDKAKKLHYRATNPTKLLELARTRREAREQSEKELELNTQTLLQTYVKTNEQAGVRYFQGEAEIGEIFEEIAKAKQEVVFVHTRAGDDFYGFKTMHNLRMLAVNNGVWRRALTPDTEIATSDYKTFDPTVLLKRTWLRQRDYSEPVEWGCFDDKLYIIAYGQEALGIVLQSQPIANAFRQLFQMMEDGQRLQPWYGRLPQHAQTPGVSTPHLS